MSLPPNDQYSSCQPYTALSGIPSTRKNDQKRIFSSLSVEVLVRKPFVLLGYTVKNKASTLEHMAHVEFPSKSWFAIESGIPEGGGEAAPIWELMRFTAESALLEMKDIPCPVR